MNGLLKTLPFKVLGLIWLLVGVVSIPLALLSMIGFGAPGVQSKVVFGGLGTFVMAWARLLYPISWMFGGTMLLKMKTGEGRFRIVALVAAPFLIPLIEYGLYKEHTLQSAYEYYFMMTYQVVDFLFTLLT